MITDKGKGGVKVLIVYASAGAGHQKCAEALYEYLQKSRPDLQVKIVNILDYTNAIVRLLYSKGYIFLICKLPWLWYLLYRLSFFFSNSPLRFFMDYRSGRPFIDLLKAEKFEVVLSTHFLASSIITVLKKKESVPIFRFISVITDYNLHPFWLGEGVDLYLTSCDYVKKELSARGVDMHKIKTYGIPVKHKFYLPSDRKLLAEKLRVSGSEFTVLIITGAVGIGPIEQIVESLAGSAQLLVVCGKNKGLYQRLVTMNLKLVKPYPLIDNVDELMSVSDVVLTKAGGLTIAESLAKGLPMVFFSSIPGLETANARVICGYRAAFNPRTIEQIKKAILTLKNESAVYQNMSANIQQLRQSDTLKNISLEI